jgi:hypothetical protein
MQDLMEDVPLRTTIWASIALATAFAARAQMKTATAHQIPEPGEFDFFTPETSDTPSETSESEATYVETSEALQNQAVASGNPSEDLITIQERLLEDPHDEKLLMKLESMAVMEPDLGPGILNFVQDLAEESSAAVIQESLGRLHARNRDWAESVIALEKAAPWTTRPLGVGAEAILARLQLGEWQKAITRADELEKSFSEWWTGRRDPSLIKDKVEPEILGAICFLRAIALVKLGQIQSAERSLSTCGAGILALEDQKRIQQKIMPKDLAGWRDQDINEILD